MLVVMLIDFSVHYIWMLLWIINLSSIMQVFHTTTYIVCNKFEFLSSFFIECLNFIFDTIYIDFHQLFRRSKNNGNSSNISNFFLFFDYSVMEFSSMRIYMYRSTREQYTYRTEANIQSYIPSDNRIYISQFALHSTFSSFSRCYCIAVHCILKWIFISADSWSLSTYFRVLQKTFFFHVCYTLVEVENENRDIFSDSHTYYLHKYSLGFACLRNAYLRL